MSVQAYLSAVPRPREGLDVVEATPATFRAVTDDVHSATPFGTHVHEDDQLAWMTSGSVEVGVRGESWRLRGPALMWIPVGVPHAMTFPEPGQLLSLYAHPALRPVGPEWGRPRVLGGEPLTLAVLEHLLAPMTATRRRQLQQLLVDLLADAESRHDVIALPRDPRARSAALAVLDDPADPRELADFAVAAGVSAKTIARAFVAETGQTFRQWRLQARLHAAASHLLAGMPVGEVAERVGYATASGFIAAFAERFGTTPARYVRGSQVR